MKILISGGHLTPALAFIDFVQKNHLQDKIVFVGREFSQNQLKQKAVERVEVENRGIKFIPFEGVSADVHQWSDVFIKPIKFLASLIKAFQIYNRERPDLFLSFGGYLAVPLALVAKVRSVPVVTHEQTRVAGKATQLIAKLADKVAISFKTTAKFFPPDKTRLTGNPLRPSIFRQDVKQPDWIDLDPNVPLLLIMGGNQGSKKINQTVKQVLPQLIKDWQIVHLCGRPNLKNNYKLELKSAAADLDPNQQARYLVKEWITGSELSWLYRQAHGAISRAGINSLLELTTLQVPTIFIPLPEANFNEQFQNAQWLLDLNAALLLRQSDLNPHNLLFNLKKLKQRHQHLQQYLSEIRIEPEADQALYQLLKQTYESQ